jgi:MFS family permease
VTRDGRLVFAAQAVRAFVYGFASVLLGVTLDARGWSTTEVGVLLTAILAGTGLLSLVVGRYAERVGCRRLYLLLFLGLAASGIAFAVTTNVVVLMIVALTGTLSTEVVESGPFTSLEQAMLPETVPEARRTRVFGTYNAVATIAGSFGALAAGGPALLRDAGVGLPADQRFFLVLVPVGLAGVVIATALSPAVEADSQRAAGEGSLRGSRAVVLRLAGLFALDSFGGGFAVQSFLVFFLSRKFELSPDALGAVFFAVGFLQAASFLAATRLAERVGLLNTMVFTHLPSNLLLAAVALAPNAPIAIALVLARFALSQMDVPTRQAYVVELVDPDERVAAAAYTATARYTVRPVAPVLGGALQQVSLGLPLVVAGGIKTVYDLALWSWFRRVPLPTHVAEEVIDDPVPADGAGPRRPTPAVPGVDRWERRAAPSARHPRRARPGPLVPPEPGKDVAARRH